MKKKIVLIALVATFMLGTTACSGGTETQETTVAETTVVETTAEPTTIETNTEQSSTLSAEEKEENYKLFCDEYDYNDVLFAPDRYYGLYCKFTGKVTSLCKEDGSWFVLTDDNGNMIDVHCAAEYFERNDKVEVYGTISDVKSTYYSNKSIIIVNAKYIDFI
ncbi:MAG: hypothetical protein ACI4XI_03560 [Ruminococcus sp.]